MAPESLSLAQARRLALAAQGFLDPRPQGAVDRRHLRRVIARVGVVQLDSVNVVVRSHEVPFFSRLGPYRRGLVEELAYRDRELFEYWAHEASLVPVSLHPYLRWRMHRAETWGGMARVARERAGYVEAVLQEVTDRGPIAASELSDPGERRGPWWGWGDGKRALEWLFWTGQLTAAGRRGFERLYDLPARVLPASVLDQPTPPEDEAIRHLLVVAARACGVATAADLFDYFRLKERETPGLRERLAELVSAGALVPVTVEGWRERGYVLPDVTLPRRVPAGLCTVLSPFDSLVWFRPRAERLFGFRYRLEIFVPAAKRVHGYYVLPVLAGDRFVGRVDAKADRRTGRLLALAPWLEQGVDVTVAAAAMASTLTSLAAWLDLPAGVVVGEGGTPSLAVELGRAVENRSR